MQNEMIISIIILFICVHRSILDVLYAAANFILAISKEKNVHFAEWISGQAAPLRKSNGMIGKRKKLLQNTKQNTGWLRSNIIARLSDQYI